MLAVVDYTVADEKKVVAFIKRIQADAVCEPEILARAVLIKADDDIVGMVSYVSFNSMGVIRYFLYDARVAGVDVIVALFAKLYQNAHVAGIKQLAVQTANQTITALFTLLGFTTLSDGAMVINLEDK